MKVKSPLANYDNVTLLKTFSSENVVNDWEKNFNIDISSELKSEQDFYLYLCNDTGLRFFYPLDIFGSPQLYEKLMEFKWYYMANKWEYRVALQDLPKNSKSLEVGCGYGHFVRQASEKGFQIEGIDSNTRAIVKAQKDGLNVYNLSTQDLLIKGASKYDCLCSFQVLEHLPNPLEFLKDCVSLLKNGGLLLLSVPNIDSFLRYQYNLLDMPPHHMTQWSVDAFQALQRLLPLKLEDVRYEPLASYHISGYLQAKQSQFEGVLSRLPNFLSDAVFKNYEKALKSGLTKYTRGQSLYVKFRKK